MGFEADLLEASESSTSADDFAAWTLQRLQTFIGFDSGIIVSVSDSRPRAHHEKRPYLHLLRRVAAEPARYTASIDKGRLAARDGAYLDTAVYSPHERSTLPFYVDIVRPQGITAQLCASTGFGGKPSSAVYLCRHDRAVFRPRDLERLRRFVPVLALAEAALVARQPALPLDLTAREQQIVGYLCAGLRNRDIAQIFGTSPNTVRNQLRRLFEKLNVSNRAELVAACLRARNDPANL